MGAVVVARDRQNAPVPMRAGEVGAVERIPRAVHAWPLAVPHTEDAIDVLAGKRVQLLRAEKHGGGEVFIDARLELDARGVHHLAPAPKLPIQHAEGGAAIAGDEAAGVEAGGLVETALFEEQAQQGLDAGQQNGPIQIGKARIEGDVADGPTGGNANVHERTSCWVA